MSAVLDRLPLDEAYPHVVDAAEDLQRAIVRVPPELRTRVLRGLGWRIEEMRRELELAARRWPAPSSELEAAIAGACDGR